MEPVQAVHVNGEAGKAFVQAKGNARDLARLEGIFGRQVPERAVVQELERLQNRDGGFPLGQQPGAPSSIDTTCYLLAQLRDIPPLKGSPMASRAVAFLRRSQQTDGSWSEPADPQAAAPLWAAAQNPHAAAYLTANAAYNLVVMEPEHHDPIARAGRWLRAGLAQAGAAAPTQTLAMATAVLTHLSGPDRPEADVAHSLVVGRNLDATDLAWWLTPWLETGVPGHHLALLLQGLQRLAALQLPDGGWPGEEGLELEATLMALRIFRGFRLI